MNDVNDFSVRDCDFVLVQSPSVLEFVKKNYVPGRYADSGIIKGGAIGIKGNFFRSFMSFELLYNHDYILIDLETLKQDIRLKKIERILDDGEDNKE